MVNEEPRSAWRARLSVRVLCSCGRGVDTHTHTDSFVARGRSTAKSATDRGGSSSVHETQETAQRLPGHRGRCAGRTESRQ